LNVYLLFYFCHSGISKSIIRRNGVNSLYFSSIILCMCMDNAFFVYSSFHVLTWRGRGVYCFTSVRPSVQDIFRRIFLSNCWWQKSDIWSQASYRYPISWKAFLDPPDSYFLFADFVDFYTHLTYICIYIFRIIFLSNYW
jgi:hypothetical protein